MEGEEEEASNVTEPQVVVEDGTAATAGANEDLRRTERQCEPQPQTAPAEERPLPRRHEVVGATGDGDAIGGEESRVEDVKEEEMEKNDVETGTAPEEEEKVAAEVQEEEEKVVIGVEEESAMVVGEIGVADVADAGEETVAVVAADEAVESEVGGGPQSVEAASGEEREMMDEEEKVDDKADEAEVGNEDGVEELPGSTEAVANVADDTEVVEDKNAAVEEANLAAQVERTEETEVAVAAEVANSAAQVEETEMKDVTAKGEEEEEEEEKEGEEAEGNEDRSVAQEALEAEAMEEAEAEVADVTQDGMEETTEAEETEAVDEAEGVETVEEEEVATRGGKRKRKKNVKPPVKVPSKKKMEEDVCFICFDGGELVLCDRRGCPKAYHPSCVDRDEAFFRTKGRWNCGWHLCSNCGKNAYYMCYTCTFSLCKACIKSAVILCVRGNKGFCETCMKTIMAIENNENNVDFDDRSSFEYLFKDYWMDLKGKLSLTLDELAEAKNPWKGSDSNAHKEESADEPFDTNNDVGSDSDGSTGNLESSNSKRRKTRRRSKSRTKDKGSRSTITSTGYEGLSIDNSGEWASKELLEFVTHMKNGDASVLSQFDVQALLLEYIKRNKLRDPRRKSQIICDTRLQNLFGKPRVGHFEMLKLLESHFLIKEESHADDFQGSTADMEASPLEADGNSDAPGRTGKDKKRKTRRKGDGRGPQSNLDDYAAINMHNINLIYLRRNLVEDLIDDTENFHEKVVGAFVRIRISGSGQKQDLYRLVQVIGTCKAAEPYKVGKRMTDILLEILNLNKTEIVSIDIVSNQEFTEDECKRLRQSIKCGFINRLTVGDVQEKAMALQAVRVKDWLESEVVRLSHLRDRASEKGRRKELRECVEKLQLLKTPEERKRRLEEIPEIHADPNMDPNFESEEEEETDDKRQESYTRPRGSAFGRRGWEPVSPRKGGSALSDAWSGTRTYSGMNQELSRSMSSRGFSNKVDDTTGVGEMVSESWNVGRDREMQAPSSWEKHKMSNLETGSRSTQSGVISGSFPVAVSENSGGSAVVVEPAAKINESEKIWHYQDPSGKVQGPFSIVQLRKWNATGYFPIDLRIWKANEKQDDSLLLTDALAGKFHKEKVQVVHNLHQSPSHSGKLQGLAFHRATEVQVGGESWRSQSELNSLTGKVTPMLVDAPKYSSDGWGSTNLPSPTPTQTPKVQAYENKWSGNSVQSAGSLVGVNQFPGNTGGIQESMMRSTDNSKPETTTNDLPTQNPPTISAHVLNPASINTGADIKNVVSNLQSLVQSVAGHLPSVETQGWGTASVQKPEMNVSTPTPGSESQPWRGPPSQVDTNNHGMIQAQPPAHGQWGDAPTINTPTSSFNSGNEGGNFPTTGFQTVLPSDPWRPVSSNQPNMQPPAPANVPWDMGVAGSQGVAPRMGQENQNPSWGPVAANPNMGWTGRGPGNANMNWGGVPGQGMVPGNSNPGWGGAPSHGPPHGNPVSGWGPPPMNTNANQSWAAHGQGQPPGNANPAWGAPSGNQGSWGSDRSHNNDRFANQRDMGPQGGDSGYGGGKPWNRQSSFGSGGSSRPPFKGQRVCKFHESGHCKKGASCDYLHT